MQISSSQTFFPKTANPQSYENTDGRPSWSPDSSKIVAELGRDVVVMSREDHSVLNKIGPEGRWVHSPDWSPDGKEIVYSTYTKHREDSGSATWGVYKCAPDGSNAQLLSADGTEAEWNPQGDKIAFQLQKFHYNNRIAVIDADGSNMKIANKGGTLQRDLSWSPDGHQIAYDTINAGTYQTRITDITGTKDRKLTDGSSGSYIDKNPEWSPDGKKILFERHDKYHPSNSLMTIDPRTKEEREIMIGSHRHLDAAWSPDGSKIAFASNLAGGRPGLDIFVMDANGTNIQQISDMHGDEHAPSWSPDGKAIAFNRFDPFAEDGKENSVHIMELKKA